MSGSHLHTLGHHPRLFLRVQIEHNMVAWDKLLDDCAACVDVPEIEGDFLDWVREFAKTSLGLLFTVNLKRYTDPVSALDEYTDEKAIQIAVEDLLDMARQRKKNPHYLKTEFLLNRK